MGVIGPDDDYKPQEFLSELASCGAGVQIFRQALILNPEKIEIADRVRIDDYARVEGGDGVKIGRHVHIASFASILGGGRVEIGDFVGLAQGARLISGSGHPYSDEFPTPAPVGDAFHRYRGRVTVEQFAFVAANAVVLPDVTIGRGGLVAAGAVANRDVEPWTIVGGVPARPIGRRVAFID